MAESSTDEGGITEGTIREINPLDSQLRQRVQRILQKVTLKFKGLGLEVMFGIYIYICIYIYIYVYIYIYIYTYRHKYIHSTNKTLRSLGGRVVIHSAAGAKGSGFNSPVARAFILFEI